MENKTIGSALKAIGGSIAAIAILIIGQLVSQVLANQCGVIGVPSPVCNVLGGLLYIGLSYIILRLVFNKLFKIPAEELGMPRFGIRLKWIIVAILLPVAVKGLYLLAFKGEYVSSGMSSLEIAGVLTAGIVFTGIAAGYVEEMVFRGVIMHLLEKRWNKYVAIIIPSLLFGVVHIIGMDYSIVSTSLVILAGTMVGVMFSLIAREGDSVWNSGIVHAVWNIVIIGGGLYISEKADKYSVMTYVLKSKSFAVTGGQFGIEASAISFVAYIIVAVIAFAMIIKKGKSEK